jgi:hypothetical protein
MLTFWLFPEMPAGGVKIVAAPLAVCGELRLPQLPVFGHVKDQVTPALVGSLLTVAVSGVVVLIRIEVAGAG